MLHVLLTQFNYDSPANTCCFFHALFSSLLCIFFMIHNKKKVTLKHEKIKVRRLRQLLHRCISIMFDSKTIVERRIFIVISAFLLHLFDLTLVREVSKDSLVQSIKWLSVEILRKIQVIRKQITPIRVIDLELLVLIALNRMIW